MKPHFWQILNYLCLLVNLAYVIASFWSLSSLIHVPKDILTSSSALELFFYDCRPPLFIVWIFFDRHWMFVKRMISKMQKKLSHCMHSLFVHSDMDGTFCFMWRITSEKFGFLLRKLDLWTLNWDWESKWPILPEHHDVWIYDRQWIWQMCLSCGEETLFLPMVSQ